MNLLKKILERFPKAISFKAASVMLLASAALFAFYGWTNLWRPDSGVPQPLKVLEPKVPAFAFSVAGQDEFTLLRHPMDVTASDEEIFVSDSENGRVQIFDLQGRPRGIIGGPGAGPGHLAYPTGVAVSGNELYVADLQTGAVSVFSRSGRFERRLEGGEYAQIKKPADLIISGERLYVTDLKLGSVLIFSRDGHLLSAVGTRGSGPGQLDYPNGAAVDSAGNLYVADTGNNRVSVFDPQGRFSRFIGVSPEGAGLLPSVRGVAIDAEGNLWTAVGFRSQVIVWNPEGKEVLRLGGIGPGPGQLGLPNGIAIDRSGMIWLTETANNRVSQFRY